MLHGKILRYREDFTPALANLVTAKSILDDLSANAVLSRDQALATAFIDDISPEIRYCAHELGHARAFDIDAIVDMDRRLYPGILCEQRFVCFFCVCCWREGCFVVDDALHFSFNLHILYNVGLTPSTSPPVAFES